MESFAMFEPYEMKRDFFNRTEVCKMILTLQQSKDYSQDLWGDWLRARDTLILVVMFEQSARPKEICGLKFSDIDLNKKTIFINGQNNKTRKSRTIPFCERTGSFFEKYLSFPQHMWEGSEYIFPSFGNRSKPLSPARWKHIFREKICKPSGLWKQPIGGPNTCRTSSYSLRHGRATEMLEKTGDIELVACILGHKDTRITRAYTHFTKQRWEKMQESINGTPPSAIIIEQQGGDINGY